jgi:hypothetical protein
MRARNLYALIDERGEAWARAYVRSACEVRGLVGGCLIWHPFRFRNKVPYWSPHYHYDGFIEGGYACRECKFLKRFGKRWYCDAPKDSCNGLEVTTRKFYPSDSMIVKVAEERGTREKRVRQSVSGTISYELGHCGIRTDMKRFHPLTWFGVASYRKAKLGKIVVPKNVCPICQHELELLECVGDEAMRLRCYGLLPESPDFRYSWEEDYLDDKGVPTLLLKHARVAVAMESRMLGVMRVIMRGKASFVVAVLVRSQRALRKDTQTITYSRQPHPYVLLTN